MCRSWNRFRTKSGSFARLSNSKNTTSKKRYLVPGKPRAFSDTASPHHLSKVCSREKAGRHWLNLGKQDGAFQIAHILFEHLHALVFASLDLAHRQARVVVAHRTGDRGT